MTTNATSAQERTDDKRRAAWERFTMTVCGGNGGGYVNVRNDSHDNPGEHIHSVHVTNGEADGCSCKHATYRDAHCKHQIAVEQRPLVVASADAASAASAATTGKQVATDGGTVVESDVGSHDEDDTDDTDGDTDDEPASTDNDHAQPQTDHWDNAVQHFDDGAVGAGEKSQCQSCGAQFEIAMVAATEDSNNRNWEEFYECQNCGATGSFRFYGGADRREWTGMMDYPEEVR